MHRFDAKWGLDPSGLGLSGDPPLAPAAHSCRRLVDLERSYEIGPAGAAGRQVSRDEPRGPENPRHADQCQQDERVDVA